jgi:glutamate:Na+ symporter, ESS family
MTTDSVLYAVLVIAALILLGKWIRRSTGILRSLHLPSSITAGTLALLAGPQGLGQIVPGERRLPDGLWNEAVLDTWTGVDPMAGALIEIGFEGRARHRRRAW